MSALFWEFCVRCCRYLPCQIDGHCLSCAQAIEARRAETGTGSVHESAVHEVDAPDE